MARTRTAAQSAAQAAEIFRTFSDEDPDLADLGLPEIMNSIGGMFPGNLIGIAARQNVGKLLSNNTLIPTPCGFKRHGDLVPGDYVFGASGQPTQVMAKIGWKDRPMVRVTFDDGSSVVCDERHEWTVRHYRHRDRVLTLEAKDLTPQESGRKYAVDLCGPVQREEVDLPVDPYTYGAWLGDGTSSGGSICCGDSDVFEQITQRGWSVGEDINPSNPNCSTRTVYSLMTALKLHGMHRKDWVNPLYLEGSVAQRQAFLAGLMDTDGSCTNGLCELTSKHRAITDAVYSLATSLGNKPFRGTRTASIGDKDYGEYFRVYWAAEESPFLLPRKTAAVEACGRVRGSSRRRAIVSVEPAGTEDGFCIEVDAEDGLYLATEHCIPTHNSSLILTMAMQSNDKVGVVELEDGPDVWGSRLLAFHTGIKPTKIRRKDLTEQEVEQIRAATEDKDLKGPLISYAIGGSVEEIEKATRALVEQGCKVVFLNYLQKVRGHREDRRSEVGDTMNAFLRACAPDDSLDYAGAVPVMMSQLTRGRPDKEPYPSEMKESGDIENECRMILMLWRDSKDTLLTHIKVAKSSFGGGGLRFDYRYDGAESLVPAEDAYFVDGDDDANF